MRQPITTICACLLIGGLSSACKNFTPVDKFAGQTVAMTEVFKPMLTHSMSSCTNNVRRNSIITDRPYVAQETEQDLLRRCQDYAAQLAGTAELNDVLKRYAEVLSALANDKLANYKEEFGAMGGALGALQQSSSMTPVLDAGQLDKVVRLSTLISSIVTQQRQQSGINELLAREEDIYIIGNALKKYAQQNYQANLRDESLTLASRSQGTRRQQLSESQTLPGRAATAGTWQGHRRLRCRHDRITEQSEHPARQVPERPCPGAPAGHLCQACRHPPERGSQLLTITLVGAKHEQRYRTR